MTSEKVLYLFGRILPRFSLYLAMILRFLPQFQRQMRSVRRTQKAMGFYSSRSRFDRLRNNLRVFSAMITWSIESSAATSAAMKARGYGAKGRTQFSLFRFCPRDGLLLAVCAALVGFTVTGSLLGNLAFYYYPRISALSFSPWAVTVYLVFGILSFLPFFMEVKEDMVWKY